MMYSVTKQFSFCAAHRLHCYEGKCAHIHGHNYLVEVTISAVILTDDMIIDFNVMSNTIGAWIDKYLDHALIVCNEDKELLQRIDPIGDRFFVMEHKTTAENIACFLLEQSNQLINELPGVVTKVTVWETDKCFATYEMSFATLRKVNHHGINV